MNLRNVILTITLAAACVSAQNQQGKPTPAPSTVKPTTTPAVTTVKPANCREVSVEGDATYCIQGPICSGKGDKPAGTNCPVVGDVAVKHCHKKLKSWVDANKCVAPVNAKCQKIKTGAWGCVLDWSSTGKPTPAPTGQYTPAPTTAKPTQAPAPTTAKPTQAPTPALTTAKPTQAPAPTTAKPTQAPAPTTAKPTPATKPANCRDVSVEGDATYCIQGPICSGKGDKPAGDKCPVIGDVAVKQCHKKLKSWVDANKCVAPVNAKCQKIKTGAWGCVWDLSSTGKPTPAPSGQYTPAPTTARPTGQNTPAPTTARPTPAPSGQNTSAPTTARPTPAPTGQNTTAPIKAQAKSFASTESASSSSSGAGATVGVVAAVAAVGIIGAAVYTRKNRQQKTNTAPEHHVTVVTP